MLHFLSHHHQQLILNQGVACCGCNSTFVVLVSSNFDETLLSPCCPPTEKWFIKKLTFTILLFIILTSSHSIHQLYHKMESIVLPRVCSHKHAYTLQSWILLAIHKASSLPLHITKSLNKPVLNQPVVLSILISISHHKDTMIKFSATTRRVIINPWVIKMKRAMAGINCYWDGTNWCWSSL